MYLNLVQIAESFGVSEQVVLEWVRKEGMPHVHDRDRILFEQAPVMAWAPAATLARGLMPVNEMVFTGLASAACYNHPS